MKRIRIFNVSITLIVLLTLTVLIMTSCKKEVIKKEEKLEEPNRDFLESKIIINKKFLKDYEIDLTQEGYLIKDARGVHSIAFGDLEEWFIADNL